MAFCEPVFGRFGAVNSFGTVVDAGQTAVNGQDPSGSIYVCKSALFYLRQYAKAETACTDAVVAAPKDAEVFDAALPHALHADQRFLAQHG